MFGAGDAPTTSEWSTILLSTKVRLTLEVWLYAISYFQSDNQNNEVSKWLIKFDHN